MAARASCSPARRCATCRRSRTWRASPPPAPMSRPGLGPGDDPHRARVLLEGLGLTGEEEPARLSGGEARRAALARALAPEPDILLLDEPTNHLDLPAIEWLEQELAGLRGALVLISHDRRFLERAVARHGLARPRHDAPAGPGLRRLRGLARPGAGGGGDRGATSSTARSCGRSTGCATASPRGASATSSAASASCTRCASAGAERADARPARCGWRRPRRDGSGTLVVAARRASPRRFGERRRWCATSPPASCAATASASSGRTAPARPRC